MNPKILTVHGISNFCGQNSIPDIVCGCEALQVRGAYGELSEKF
jgi:hypothetical protein